MTGCVEGVTSRAEIRWTDSNVVNPVCRVYYRYPANRCKQLLFKPSNQVLHNPVLYWLTPFYFCLVICSQNQIITYT